MITKQEKSYNRKDGLPSASDMVQVFGQKLVTETNKNVYGYGHFVSDLKCQSHDAAFLPGFKFGEELRLQRPWSWNRFVKCSTIVNPLNLK